MQRCRLVVFTNYDLPMLGITSGNAMAAEIGVAAIPLSAFYADAELGRPLVRFAFCKEMGTLEGAIERLRRLKKLG